MAPAPDFEGLPERSAARRAYGSRQPRHYIATVLAFCAVLVAPARSHAQPTPPVQPPELDVASIARLIPDRTAVFVTTSRIDQMEGIFLRARAWKLLPLLAGTPTTPDHPLNLRRSLLAILGVRDPLLASALMRSGLSLAATSWTNLQDAVWLVRVHEPALLHRWFPLERRIGYSKIGAAEYFRTGAGMSVCVRGNIVALAKQTGPQSLFSGTLALMAGRAGRPLGNSVFFREPLAKLPPRPLAIACFKMRKADDSGGGRASGGWWTRTDRIVSGLYEERGRLELVVRARLSQAHATSKLTGPAVNRLFKLPASTLLATLTTVDFQTALQSSAADADSGSTLARYFKILGSMPEASDDAGADWTLLGPHILVVWDQDLRIGESAPQASVMVECRNASALTTRIGRTVSNLIQLLAAIEPARIENGLSVVQKRHLGARISSVPMRAYAEQSKLPFLRLLASAEPAWTVWKGWCILALSREHIERIIDADVGLVPTLETLPDVQLLPRGPGDRALLSIAQADLAASVMTGWLNAHAAGSPSLLDPAWWGPMHAQHALPPRLGIGMAASQNPGVVVVARVYPQTAADGRLRSNDRIIGIDGRLLALEEPNADLRRGWLTSTGEPGPTVRVLREGSVLEIVLPKRAEKDTTLLAELRANPADPLRELVSLARNIQFASFTVVAADQNQYSATLSLRFMPPSRARATRNR